MKNENIDIENIENILKNLHQSVFNEKYKGYDPYDILNSKALPISYILKNKNIGLGLGHSFIQVGKRCPNIIRKVLNVKKGYNAKGLALISDSLLKMSIYFDDKSYANLGLRLLFYLIKNRSKNFASVCWGYNYPWINHKRALPSHYPNVVVTSFVVNSLLNYYEYFKNDFLLKYALKSCSFFMDDLKPKRTDGNVCFSYTPLDRDRCHNANLLAAQTLLRMGFLSGQTNLKEIAEKAYDFTLNSQNADGSWDYGISPSGKSEVQLDFHQGFIIDSILELDKLIKLSKSNLKIMEKGISFYEKQFENGLSYYRYPKFYPIEIHNQAQGIITFSKIMKLDKAFLIFKKTIDNMYDSKNNYFYYQMGYLYKNKSNYVRWSQAWMIFAIINLLENLRSANKKGVL